MKRLFLVLVLLIGVSFAADKNALGLWLQGNNSGEWWGFDYKNLGSSSATDIYFRLSAYEDDFAAGIYGGYYYLNNAIKADASVGKFPIHYGPTIGVGYWNNGKKANQDIGFAIRAGAVGGISWILPTSLPMDVSAELSPVAECHFVSGRRGGTKYSDPPKWYIPELYFRLLFHAYIF